MQGALTRCVAIGQRPTSRAGTVVVIAAIGHYKGPRQVVGIDDALSGGGDIFTGSEHERGSWKRRFGRGVEMPSLAFLSRSQKPCHSVHYRYVRDIECTNLVWTDLERSANS